MADDHPGDAMYNNILHVGFDDTDSSSGMCTTYVCAVVLERLKACGMTIRGEARLYVSTHLHPIKPEEMVAVPSV